METLSITLIVLLTVAICVTAWIVKSIWNSPLFWIGCLAVTIIAFPLTSGMSTVALVTLIVLRVFLVGKIVKA